MCQLTNWRCGFSGVALQRSHEQRAGRVGTPQRPSSDAHSKGCTRMHVCSVVTLGTHWTAVSHVKYGVDIRFDQSCQCVWVSVCPHTCGLVCLSGWCGVDLRALRSCVCLRPTCVALAGARVRNRCNVSHIRCWTGACQCCTWSMLNALGPYLHVWSLTPARGLRHSRGC